MKSAPASAPTRRPYRMGARAEATQATRRAIADGLFALFLELPYEDITLERVAAHAGFSVQTVLRHFGTKDDLFAFVAHEVADDEAARRAVTTPGDVDGAVRAVVSHYERIGPTILRLLAQEDRLPALRAAADVGRRIHRDWVAQVFAPQLDGLPAPVARVRQAQLVALTDLQTWKLLRREQGLGRDRTEAAIHEMVSALLAAGS